MKHIKRIDEAWDENRTIFSKDNDIAKKILKNINDSKNISEIENESTYMFQLMGFDFEVEWDCDLFDFIHPAGYYTIKCDGEVLDIGYFLSRRIYNTIKKMYEKDSNELKSYTKKDLRISLK